MKNLTQWLVLAGLLVVLPLYEFVLTGLNVVGLVVWYALCALAAGAWHFRQANSKG